MPFLALGRSGDGRVGTWEPPVTGVRRTGHRIVMKFVQAVPASHDW